MKNLCSYFQWSLFVIFDFKNKTHAKSSSKEKPEEGSENGLRSCEPFPPETFLAVNLVRWEDDIIIDGEQARPQVR